MSYPHFFAELGPLRTTYEPNLIKRVQRVTGQLAPFELANRLNHEFTPGLLASLCHQVTGANGAYRTEPAATVHYRLLAYRALPADMIGDKMDRLCHSLNRIMRVKFDDDHQVLALAAVAHLELLCIHPFRDGNGRTARLLERFIIAKYYGAWALNLRTEAYYHERRERYCNNLRAIGPTWAELDLHKALPFLQMLPAAIIHQLNS